ncbi:integrin alpha FG-GAP repeat-containing protein 2 [Apophysomyces ossiformis]|uniref:Integrin alpha FG-GAP repeat-containing protein 2 n=1 Tax=Apophysomyces ossiformis TaxID=679940 RepID=A0A8H7ET32_9FUNG|nr:integrin alpha FG-GAP repeat-containing protein 2 [Apophysomyces ossiformis]
MNPHALVIGDVDNDGGNEFVIGNLNGDLAIFKGECPLGLPTFICRGLGTITCIAIGDARNHGKNSVVCINAEGHAHIFDIPASMHGTSSGNYAQHHMSIDEYLKHGRRSSDTASIQAFRRMMTNNTDDNSIYNRHHADHQKNTTPHIHNLRAPNLTLKVPVNVNRILIADIDGDGLNELILARTDRILHAFQLVRSDAYYSPDPTCKDNGSPSLGSSSTSASSPNITNPSQQYLSSPLHTSLSVLSISREKGKRSSLTDQKDTKTSSLRKGMGWPKQVKTSAKDVKDAESTKSGKPVQNMKTEIEKMYLLDKDMWVFDGQITSLSTTMHPDKPNEPILLVAQPGNTFTIIDREGNRFNRDFTPQYSPSTHYGKHKQRKHSMYFAQPEETKPKVDEKIEAEEEDLATTPKANQGPFSNLRKATQTIRTLLQGSGAKASVPTGLETENLIVSKDDGGLSDIKDPAGNEIRRSNYVVQNWPIMNGDDIIGDEESGAVATEIVVGKRHQVTSDPSRKCVGTEVGMLSMDGKFTVYDLRTKTSSQSDLFVTHKLFSLATLDISTAHTHCTQLNMRPDRSSLSSNSPQPRLPAPFVRTDSASSNALSPGFSRLSISNSGMTEKNETKNTSQNDAAAGLVTPTSVTSHIFSLQNNEDSGTSSDDDINVHHHPGRHSLDSSSISGSEGSWSEGSEAEDLPDNELFVACAWNGVTYLIDWSKRVEEKEKEKEGEGEEEVLQEDSSLGKSKIKFQLVKFAFEGRVCAFTAGLYAVSPRHNVPCLFYVDFEDQIFVYYDVRISPGPVDGFIDPIDDDIEEALERIVGIESGIEALTSIGAENNLQAEGGAIDLGDGWKGIVDEDGIFDTGHIAQTSDIHPNQLDLADFIHECLYGFEDMKERLDEEVYMFQHRRLSDQLPLNMDIRRLSDLNITIEPALERESSDSEATHHDVYGEYHPHRTLSASSGDMNDALQNWMDETIKNSSLKSD